MKEYISLFETTAAYNAAKDNLDLPNVAYCKDQNQMHYEPWASREVTITLNISRDSYPMPIINSTTADIVDHVEIDGVVPPEDTDLEHYVFDTSGEHVIKYIFNTSKIPYSCFSGESEITAVNISEGITYIDDRAFNQCNSLASITLHNKINFIEASAFEGTLWESNQPNGVLYNNSIALGYKGTLQGGEVSFTEDTITIANAFGHQLNNLTSIVVPSSVKNIGFFLGNFETNSITFKSEVPPNIGGPSDISFMINATNIYVPASAVETYKTAPRWSDYASKIQAIPTT